MDAIFAALADGHRRTILEALTEGEATAGDLAGRLPIARPGVSRHLRVLRESGLVDVEARAQQRVYSLSPHGLEQADAWIAARTNRWKSHLAALETELRRGQHESNKKGRLAG